MSNRAKSELKQVGGSFEVRFNGFADLPMERDAYEISPDIMCLGHEFLVSIYPGGHRDSEDGMVTVDISAMTNKSISVLCSFSVRHSAGREVAHKETPFLLNPKKVNFVHNFASRKTLLGALVDGALVMEVMIKQADPAELQKSFIIENPFGANMLDLFNDEESADVVFEVDSKVGEHEKKETRSSKKKKLAPILFHAHRCVMKKGAPMLYELCKMGGKVCINGVKADVFGELLRYMYGQELHEDTLGANAREFIDAADRYGAVYLKLRAETEYVKTPMSTENVMDTLLYADAKNCALLKEAVMEFLVECNDDAIEKLSFDHVPGYLMKDLLKVMATRNRKEKASDGKAKGYRTMKVYELRKILHGKGLDIDGSREAMIALLEKHS